MLNNAGLMPHSPLERLKVDDWDQWIDVNIRTTVISTGALDTELVDRITEPDIREGVRKMTDEMALPAETFAHGCLRHESAGEGRRQRDIVPTHTPGVVITDLQ